MWKLSLMQNREKIKKYLTRDNLIIMVLTGILLFIVAMPVKKESGASAKNTVQSMLFSEETNSIENEVPLYQIQNSFQYSENYTTELEQRLEKILSEVEGLGEVKVMVTLVSTEEVVVEKEQSIKESMTNETDKNGGERQVKEADRNENTVTIQTDGTNTPYVRKTFFPEIEGVIVVAQGCGNGVTDKKVTELIQAVTGLSANRIMVAKMKR